MKIELLEEKEHNIARLTLTAENQAEHYQLIALSNETKLGILRRYGNPYFSLNLYLREEHE
jgi:hypothetical protein